MRDSLYLFIMLVNFHPLLFAYYFLNLFRLITNFLFDVLFCSDKDPYVSTVKRLSIDLVERAR